MWTMGRGGLAADKPYTGLFSNLELLVTPDPKQLPQAHLQNG